MCHFNVYKMVISSLIWWPNSLYHYNRPFLRFVNTKNGRIRAVPISQSLYNEIHAISNNKTDRRFFSNCRTAFRKAADRSGIEFPKGQKTHILRHTFTSHFMINGGADFY